MPAVIEMLLLNGADANGLKYHLPLVYACRSGDISMTKLLLEHGADINARNFEIDLNPIESAAFYGHREIVQTLLNKGVDLCGCLLKWAVMGGDQVIIQTLLDAGANVNAVGKDGTSGVFTEAAMRGGSHIHIIQLLFNHHAEIGLDPEALLETVFRGHFNIARLLIERGADVNWQDKYKNTALTGAAKYGRLDMAALLLENDKQLDTLEERCRQAAEVAGRNDHWTLAKYLRQYKRGQGGSIVVD